jgi:F-type H+-transporting ATPase subunit epsilon
MATEMRVKILLPGGPLFDGTAISVNAESPEGAFGILPNHIDLVTSVVPSVLLVTEPCGTERVFGVDEGLLVKKGHSIEIAVRRGVESVNLASLHETVADFFALIEDEERVARAALSRIEADMVRQFAGLRGEPRP